MKTIVLLILISAISVSISAQNICTRQSIKNGQNQKLEKTRAVDDTRIVNPEHLPSCKPFSKSIKSAPGVIETLIGGTIYDTQTNASVANRIYIYPDGTIGAVWTLGYNATLYPDRGTGYNYFDGMSWGIEPTTRIESVRTGWPCYCPLGAGELIVAHDFVNGLQISKRPLKGTGPWTTSFLAAPSGATKVSWPRAITTGNTIHIIAVSGVAYQGLDLALLYYRSTDGGITWEDPKILPGMDATSLGAGAGKSFGGFAGDSYAWAAPKGDTIAFAVSEPMGGVWIMKSFDNGDNWAKTTVLSLPILTIAPSPIIPSTDGSIAIAIDNQGKAHIVVGRMRVSDDDYVAANNNYYPHTDGLLYWNENMPQLDTTQIGDLDILNANGNILATMVDYNANDTIDFPDVASGSFPFGLYGVSMCSMGQIAIDKEDNIVVTFSACREDLFNPSAAPNIELYRHLYVLKRLKNESKWTVPVDLTDDIEHSYDECVFASLAPQSDIYKIDLVYQVDAEPGTAIGSDEDPPQENFINYLKSYLVLPPGVKQVDIAKNVMVSPNPANDYTNILVLLKDAQKVNISVYDAMNKLVYTNDCGTQTTGYHSFYVNTASLISGIYLFTVKIGNSQTSKKVIVY